MGSATSSAASTSGSSHGDNISGNGSGNVKTLQWVIIGVVVVAVALIFKRKK